MRQGESHIRVGASMARPPWPILVVIVLAILVPLLQLWPRIDAGMLVDPRGGYGWLSLLLELATGYILVALIAYGLWRGSRFVHVLAILWQLVLIGRAVDLVVLNDAGWALLWSTRHGALYYLGLPLLAGLMSLVLLLLAASWRWTSHHRGLSRL